jgi:hypothetical protein
MSSSARREPPNSRTRARARALAHTHTHIWSALARTPINTHTLAPHTRTPGDLEIRKDRISGVGIGGRVSCLRAFIQLLKEEQSAQGKSEHLLHATSSAHSP